MVSIKDIAKAVGVSVSTVSRVINDNGYVSAETRNKVLKVIEEYDYNPNFVARSLVKNKSDIIGLVIPHINDPFMLGLMDGVQFESAKEGYNVLLCYTNEDTEKEKKYLKIFTERRVDGIIIAPVGKESSYIEELSEKIPIVCVGRYFDSLNISSVAMDDIMGSYKVVKYLVEKGHKRIGIINGPLFLDNARKRWEGAVKALKDYNIEIDTNIVVESDFTLTGGYEAGLKILRSSGHPTAIYAGNHLMAYGALKAIKEKKKKVPDDVALAAFDGFDDSIFDLIIDAPRISANINPSYYIGQESVKLICEEISRGFSNSSRHRLKKNIVVNMEFVERESTGLK